MEGKLNIVIALLAIITALMLVDTFSDRISGQESSAMRNIYDDEIQGAIGGPSSP